MFDVEPLNEEGKSLLSAVLKVFSNEVEVIEDKIPDDVLNVIHARLIGDPEFLYSFLLDLRQQDKTQMPIFLDYLRCYMSRLQLFLIGLSSLEVNEHNRRVAKSIALASSSLPQELLDA